MADVVLEALSHGATVEIDGLGSFRKIGRDTAFKPATCPASSWPMCMRTALRLTASSTRLLAAGFDPWMDERKLLPGQNWARAIQNALETSDFAVCCFSRNSVRKRSGFQSEIRYALECTRRLPLDEIFLMPVRLDECPVPMDVAREMQYVDLFPDWYPGMGRVIEAIRVQVFLATASGVKAHSSRQSGVRHWEVGAPQHHSSRGVLDGMRHSSANAVKSSPRAIPDAAKKIKRYTARVRDTSRQDT